MESLVGIVVLTILLTLLVCGLAVTVGLSVLSQNKYRVALQEWNRDATEPAYHDARAAYSRPSHAPPPASRRSGVIGLTYRATTPELAAVFSAAQGVVVEMQRGMCSELSPSVMQAIEKSAADVFKDAERMSCREVKDSVRRSLKAELHNELASTDVPNKDAIFDATVRFTMAALDAACDQHTGMVDAESVQWLMRNVVKSVCQ